MRLSDISKTKRWMLAMIAAGLLASGCANENSANKAKEESQAAVMFRMDAAHSGVSQEHSKLKGEKSWQFDAGSAIYSSPITVDNTVYFGTSGGRFLAVDTGSHDAQWIFEADGEIRTTAAVQGNHIFFADDAGKVYALDREKGAVKWTYDMKYTEKNLDEWDYYRSSPTIHENTLFIGNGQGHLFALDVDTGEEIWRFQTNAEAPIRTTPAIKDGVVYLGDWYGALYAVDEKKGKEMWKASIGGSVQISPVIAGDLVYSGGRNAAVQAYDRMTGEQVWSKRDPAGSWMPSSPAYDQSSSTLYLGSSDALVMLALDAKTGQEKWSYKHTTHLFSSPAFANGVVYIASGYVYALEKEEFLLAFEAATGKLLWKVPIAKSYSSPFITKDAVYITDAEGILHVIQ